MRKFASKVNLLDTVPVRSALIITESGPDGHVVLVSPRFRKAWMQRLFVHLVAHGRSAHARIPLEEHGSAVWRLIDGRRTVSNIILCLADHFPQGEEYAPRVCAYIAQLYRDGFIRLLGNSEQ